MKVTLDVESPLDKIMAEMLFHLSTAREALRKMQSLLDYSDDISFEMSALDVSPTDNDFNGGGRDA